MISKTAKFIDIPLMEISIFNKLNNCCLINPNPLEKFSRHNFMSLTAVKYSSGYLLFTSYSMTCFRVDWVHMFQYKIIKGLDSREITSLPNRKKVMNMAHHFNHRLKKHMLITRLICILQWKFITPFQLDSPSKFCWSFAHKGSFLFTCSKVNNAFKQKKSLTDPFWKSSTSFESHIVIIVPSFHGLC